MNAALRLAVLLVAAPVTLAADPAAGKARASAVCAACHGANGVSVGEGIPNLAAQREAYLVAQLKALKAGSRKSEVMNAIASQLGDAQIAELAAYFASLPGAEAGARSALLPNLRPRAVLPAGYPAGFERYLVMGDPDARVVRHFMANEAARRAASEGRELPEGAAVVTEVRQARAGEDGRLLKEPNGDLAGGAIRAYAVMARGPGWGAEIPDLLRNGDWNYALLGADGQPRAGLNQAECLACHKPEAARSYVFTLKALAGTK